MRPAALLVLLALLLSPPPEAPRTAGQQVDLVHACWSLDGRPADEAAGAVVEPAAADDPAAAAAGERASEVVRLPFARRDARWTCEFVTDGSFTARLELDWRPGPDGLLFEIMLDGQRLSPARDGWRPSPRDLRSDLGSAWLGTGRHLLELIAREQAPAGVLRLRALRLGRL